MAQGDFARETVYGDDPLPLAQDHARAGARRLHVVDLDAALGSGNNRPVVGRLVAESGLAVQVAGGVRSHADVEAWLAAGAAAVVMGTTAVRDPALLAECAAHHPGRVLAALDVRGGRPAVQGWKATEELSVGAVLASWAEAPLAEVIVTSVDRDGMLAGPDLGLLAAVRDATQHRLAYSGGIGSMDDLDELARAGADAAILGKSLLEGRFTLAQALSRC